MSESQQTSRYLPIWKAMKEHGECRITAPPNYHRRIIKMVKNRRDKDTAFLYQLAETNRTHRIKTKINGTVIHFYLHIYLSIGGL